MHRKIEKQGYKAECDKVITSQSGDRKIELRRDALSEETLGLCDNHND